ncbi:MAG: hypothetical protein M1823_008744, partial [Watsoniomyces obsoletus]
MLDRRFDNQAKFAGYAQRSRSRTRKGTTKPSADENCSLTLPQEKYEEQTPTTPMDEAMTSTTS